MSDSIRTLIDDGLRSLEEIKQNSQKHVTPIITYDPVGFRDVHWCNHTNEPFIISYDENNEPFCPNCETGFEYEDHPFLVHIKRPNFINYTNARIRRKIIDIDGLPTEAGNFYVDIYNASGNKVIDTHHFEKKYRMQDVQDWIHDKYGDDINYVVPFS